MVYVTSMPIAEPIVEYYLALLPGVIPSHARARLNLVAVYDSSPRSLSEKLQPRAGAHSGSIPDRSRSHIIPYNTTELERDVAVTLGIPMYGADPRLADLGSKTGCRRLFELVGVPHPLGAENLHTLDDIVAAIRDDVTSHPGAAPGRGSSTTGCPGAAMRSSCSGDLPAPGAAGELDAKSAAG